MVTQRYEDIANILCEYAYLLSNNDMRICFYGNQLWLEACKHCWYESAIQYKADLIDVILWYNTIKEKLVLSREEK